jgi:hypothetical protein
MTPAQPSMGCGLGPAAADGSLQLGGSTASYILDSAAARLIVVAARHRTQQSGAQYGAPVHSCYGHVTSQNYDPKAGSSVSWEVASMNIQ